MARSSACVVDALPPGSPAGQEPPPLLDRLRARTSPVRQPKRGPLYNHPYLWYCRPDGDVVLLPGDPGNRAYYEDKGFAVLRPEEVAEWRGGVRAAVLAEQREKAALLTTIRRLGARHPGVQVVSDLDALTCDELRELLDELGKATGAPVKVVGARFLGREAERDQRHDGGGEAELGGVTVGGNPEELRAKVQKAAAVGRYHGEGVSDA